MSRNVVAAVTLVVSISLTALAGCLDAGNGPGGTTPPATPTSPTPEPRVRLPPPVLEFSTPVVLGSLQGGAEPSVAVAPDGTAYVTTPLALWRSKDNMATWQPIGTPFCPFGAPACPGIEEYEPGMKGGGDADLYVSPDGVVHWLGLFDQANAIPYQSSHDQGDTWSEVTDLAGDDSGDREWITGRADGTLFAAWRNFPSQGDAKIVMRASYDGGATWTETADVADDTRQGGIAVDPSSNALALAYDMNGPVSVARSLDNGTTWESTQVVSDPVLGHVFPVLAYDTNGTLYLIISHDPDGPPQGLTRPFETPNVYMFVSHDKGVTWSEGFQVNADGTTAWFPWVAAGSAGRLVVVWYQNDQGLPRQAGGEVYVMAAVSLDADFPDPKFTRARASPNPVHRGPECRETPGVCTRSLLDFFEVAIHPSGVPVIAWAQDIWQVPRDEVATSHVVSDVDLWGT